MTTMDQLPSDVADALREIVSTEDFDKEIPSLVVLAHVMEQLDTDTAGRVTRYLWDRYVEQPQRDAMKMQTAAAPDA